MFVEDGQLKFRALGVSPDIITTTAPAANQWQQVVANYTGSALQIWLNGSLAASVNATGTPATSSENLYIGFTFAGQLDDVALYKRSLTGPEIRAQYLYQLGLVAERQSFKRDHRQRQSHQRHRAVQSGLYAQSRSRHGFAGV